MLLDRGFELEQAPQVELVFFSGLADGLDDPNPRRVTAKSIKTRTDGVCCIVLGAQQDDATDWCSIRTQWPRSTDGDPGGDVERDVALAESGITNEEGELAPRNVPRPEIRDRLWCHRG